MFLVACGGGKGSENAVDSTATAIPENGGGIGIPELFGPFYQKFCSDKDFQKSRITFPLPMQQYKYKSKDRSVVLVDSTYWEPNSWIEYLPYDKFVQEMKVELENVVEGKYVWNEKIDSSRSGVVVVDRVMTPEGAFQHVEFRRDGKTGNYRLVKFITHYTDYNEDLGGCAH